MHRHTAFLELDFRKATRLLLPYLGEAFIEVSFDDISLGEFRIESIAPIPLRIALGPDIVGSGTHRIRIKLGVRSNATLRMHRVRIVRPQ